MANFIEDIREAINGERVDGVSSSAGQVTWDEFVRACDYDYDDGYGTEGCHPVHVWTETRVLFIACYDGATWVASVPRNPSDEAPKFVGGG